MQPSNPAPQVLTAWVSRRSNRPSYYRVRLRHPSSLCRRHAGELWREDSRCYSSIAMARRWTALYSESNIATVADPAWVTSILTWDKPLRGYSALRSPFVFFLEVIALYFRPLYCSYNSENHFLELCLIIHKHPVHDRATYTFL